MKKPYVPFSLIIVSLSATDIAGVSVGVERNMDGAVIEDVDNWEIGYSEEQLPLT